MDTPQYKFGTPTKGQAAAYTTPTFDAASPKYMPTCGELGPLMPMGRCGIFAAWIPSPAVANPMAAHSSPDTLAVCHRHFLHVQQPGTNTLRHETPLHHDFLCVCSPAVPAVNFLLGQPPAPVQLQNGSIVTVAGSKVVNLHGVSW